MKNEILKRAISLIQKDISLNLSKAIYMAKNNKDESYKYQDIQNQYNLLSVMPKNKDRDVFWFTFDGEGQTNRINALNQLINENIN